MSFFEQINTKIPITIISTSMTRPADTPGAYTIDDVISSSTSAGTYMAFTSVGLTVGQSCNIVGAMVTCSIAPALLASLEIWLFKEAPTAVNDHSAFTITDAENNNVVGVLDMTGVWKKSALNSRYDLNTTNIPIVLGTTANLFGIIVCKNAYIPAASDVFTVTLKVERM